MHDLITISRALLHLATTDGVISPIATSTARDLLCLAETEMRLSMMIRTAAVDSNTPTLPQMFDKIRNSNRDCAEIISDIEKMEIKHNGSPTPSLSKDVGSTAVERLMRMATSADSLARHDVAAEIDDLLASIITTSDDRP